MVEDFTNSKIHAALYSCMMDFIDPNDIRDAMEIKDRESRFATIERILRTAYTEAPIVVFGSVPHVFDGRKYSPFSFGELHVVIRSIFDGLGIYTISYNRMLNFVKACMLSNVGKRREVDNTVLVMENGVFDTRDQMLHEFSEDYITNSYVDYPYGENYIASLWHKFLDEVLPDESYQELLQEFIACCFVDRKKVKMEQMMILKGPGSNGKSVIFETLLALFGHENVTTFSIAELIGPRREQNTAAICGKRLNYCSEIRTIEIGKKNADAFKSLVSGEPTMARELYKEPFKATGIPIIMANANTLPTLGDTSDSIKRRLIILPFDTIIPPENQNKELSTELQFELSGIFNWVMEGYTRLLHRDFKLYIPMSIRSIVEDYAQDNSVVMRWLTERRIFKMYHPYTQAIAEWCRMTDLHDDFMRFCNSNHEQPKDAYTLALELESLGFTRARRANGFGFYIYKALSSDALQQANMDLAIARERKFGLQNIKAKIQEEGKVFVSGVNEVEAYLGLPKDSIWYYLLNGYVEGSYQISQKGYRFDVVDLQDKLARAGYYTELKGGEKGVKERAFVEKRTYARRFNERMRMAGEPFRVYDNSENVMNMCDKGVDIILVPPGWEYSAENAKKMMKMVSINSKTKSLKDNKYEWDQ